jgi:predicted nucleic-acid-binding protein
MRAADTNILIRLIVRDDARQAAAAAALLEQGIWISTVVVMENVWVLESVYKFDRSDISTAMRMLLDLETGVTEDNDAVRSAIAAYERSARIGFEDCLILETARRAGQLPLATFDRALARLDGVELIA